MKLSIERIAVGGDAIAHAPDGRIVFVEGGFPGDDVAVVVHEEKKRFMRAKLDSVEKASPARLAPAETCPVAERCGGCRFQEVRYEDEFAWKVDAIDGTLRRLGGGVSWPEDAKRVAAEQIDGYRTRARLHVGPNGVGFYAQGSHEVVNVEVCRALHPSLDAARAIAGEVAAEARVSEVFMEWDEVRSTVSLEVRGEKFPYERLTAWIQEHFDRLRGHSIGSIVAATETESHAMLGDGRTHRFVPIKGQQRLVANEAVAQFSQAHRAMNELLCAHVHEAISSRVEVESHVADLYSGAGNLGLGLLARGYDVTFVEHAGPALSAARSSARKLSMLEEGETEVGQFRFLAANLSEHDSTVNAVIASAEALVLDPPRGGLSKAMRSMLRRKDATTLVYVSCDAPALARDASSLTEAGWKVVDLSYFDLFPRTPHVEVVATFERQ